MKRKSRKQVRKKALRYFLNILHSIILFTLLLYILHGIYLGRNISTGNYLTDLAAGLYSTGVNEIFTFIGAVAFVLFGIVGIYEFAYINGLIGLYPPFFGEWKERRDEKAAEVMMRTYYENDKAFLQQFERERFESVLQMLGVDEKQFRHLSYELLRARAFPTDNLDELCDKAESLVFYSDFIEDLTKRKTDRVYDDVDYFINLYTAAYDKKIRDDLGKIMASYILISLGDIWRTIDYIVIPQESNLLMGLEVGECLGKPIISIQSKPRIYQNESWDGEYRLKPGPNGGKNRIIILHDILVTGTRVLDAVKKLPQSTFEVIGLFFLAKYKKTGNNPEASISSDLSIDTRKIHCLLTITEDRLKLVIKDKK